MHIQTLHTKAKKIADQYKKSERDLVSIIAQVDQLKGFYKLGYSSLFTYMTEGLGLTVAVASNISAVVRKSYDVPQLKNKVVSGEISLSKARKLTPVINRGNQDQWISLARSKTQKQIEREVALAQPKSAILEKTQYVPIDTMIKEKVQIKRDLARMKLELGVSEKLMLKLRRCQDLESQRQKKSINLEECLEALTQLYLEKKDPIKKAQRQMAKGKLQEEPVPQSQPILSVSDRSTRRTRLPAKVKHQVQLRDHGQCTHIDDKGRRCSSRRYLEIHHQKPLSHGGDNSLQNLRLLCSGHHKVHHL
jgi:hypothetical protein